MLDEAFEEIVELLARNHFVSSPVSGSKEYRMTPPLPLDVLFFTPWAAWSTNRQEKV